MTRQIVLTDAPLRVARALVDGRRRIVTPNRRASQAVGAVEAGSLVELAAGLLPAGWRVAPEAIVTRELTAAVRGVVGGQHAARQAVVMAGGLARLLRSGADLDRLAKEGSERVRLLSRVALDYRRRLADRGMVDPAEMLHLAAREVSSTAPLLVHGYARLDADDRAFLNAYAGDGSVLVLPDGAKTMFDENQATARELVAGGWEQLTVTPAGEAALGERVAACYVAGRGVAPGEDVRIYACADAESEVRAALAEVKQRLLQGVPASAITVVTRDEERYAPLVLKIAAEFRMPVHPQTSGPLSQTRLGAYLGRLLTILVEDAPYETTLGALADPLAGGLLWQHRAEAQSRRARGLETWRALLPDHPVLAALADHRERSLDDWLVWLRALLQASKLPQRLLEWPRERIAYGKLQDGLALLDGDELLTAEQFAMEFADLLGSYTVPLDPSRGGVALHTPLALYGSVYDHVFVLGTAAGQLPAALHEDPFLDTVEREGLTALGVRQESAVEQALRERLSFWMMLQAAGQRLVFCHPRVIDAPRPNEPVPGQPGAAGRRAAADPGRSATGADLRSGRTAGRRSLGGPTRLGGGVPARIRRAGRRVRRRARPGGAAPGQLLGLVAAGPRTMSVQVAGTTRPASRSAGRDGRRTRCGAVGQPLPRPAGTGGQRRRGTGPVHRPRTHGRVAVTRLGRPARRRRRRQRRAPADAAAEGRTAGDRARG